MDFYHCTPAIAYSLKVTVWRSGNRGNLSLYIRVFSRTTMCSQIHNRQNIFTKLIGIKTDAELALLDIDLRKEGRIQGSSVSGKSSLRLWLRPAIVHHAIIAQSLFRLLSVPICSDQFWFDCLLYFWLWAIWRIFISIGLFCWCFSPGNKPKVGC